MFESNVKTPGNFKLSNFVLFTLYSSVNRNSLAFVTNADQRSSPLMIKKISNSNNRVVVVTQSVATTPTTITTINKPLVNTTTTTNQRVGGPSGFIQVRQNLMASPSNTTTSTIDLTDEDDVPKTRNMVNNPPALVSLNAARNRSAITATIVQSQQIGARPQVLAPQPQVRSASSATSVRKFPVIGKLNKNCSTTTSRGSNIDIFIFLFLFHLQFPKGM